jgi:hypothetical protein
MTITYEQISAFEAGLVREEAASSTVKRYTGIVREFALYLGERKLTKRSFWSGERLWAYVLPPPM